MNRHFALLPLFLFANPSALAAPVTVEVIRQLPVAEQAVWNGYLERSQALARADAAALKAELATHQMAAALKAPSGGDFKLSEPADDSWFAGEEAGQLATIILSYQTPAGGWSKHTGYSHGPRQPGMQWTSQNEPGAPPHYLGTFDNRSTTEQIVFLAKVWQATRRDDCRAAAIRGLDYLLAAQFPSGGWPQVYPLEGGYHDSITFNDDAMAHIIDILAGIVAGEAVYGWVDDPRRAKVEEALKRGVRCVLAAQVVQGGRKTGWCAQHDAITLRPDAARKMEPVALSGLESANLLATLMKLRSPSAECIAAIEDGLAWLDRVKITGMARVERDGKTTYEAAPQSTEVFWARFYDVADSRPVFPGRDGVLYATFAEMAAHNKLGYDFYTTRPGSVVNNGRKKWRKMLADGGRS